MRLQNMIQLSCSPPQAWARTCMAFVRKTKFFLKVLTNPFCQLGGPPAQNWVAGPVHIFQPALRRKQLIPNWQHQVWGEILVLKLESAGLEKVDIKAYTSRQLFGVILCIIQYVKYRIEYTIT